MPHGEAEYAHVAEAVGVSLRGDRREESRSCSEVNPMLGHRGCRLGDRLPGDHGDAGAGHPRGSLHRASGRGSTSRPEIMIPLVGTKKELERPGRSGAGNGGGRLRRAGRHGRLPGGDDDRGPARCTDRRYDRRGGGVLQLRHQRSHADDLWREPRRCRQVPAAVRQRGEETSGRPTRSRHSMSRAWASSSRSASSGGGRHVRT